VLAVGQVLDGRYEVLEALAEGGMGAVFRARRVLLGDDVAIKIIRSELAGPTARERFIRESRACAHLRHPHIVSILDYDVDPTGDPFLVMELLNGRSLKDEIAVRGSLDPSEVQRIFPPVCAALQLAHEQGIVHRDLKPANIVAHDFGRGERVYKIVDFGVANMRTGDATRLTSAHQFLGTITYASPEQLSGSEVDGRSDIYSLGAVLFEVLTGRPPFEGSDPLALVTRQVTEPAPRPSSVRPDLPPWVDGAVGRALEKSPDARWMSMAELGAVIGAGGGEAATTVAVPASSALSVTYEIGDRLGPGRLGSEVYRGVHRALGHPVAVRILRRRGQRNWDALRARFLHEAQAMQIAHPSIIQVRDYGEEPALVYVVTDFIEGHSLREILSASGPMPWPRLRPLLAQLLEAARLLHRRKGLLCGLSPEIMRVSPADELDDEDERLLISTAGIWEAQDLLATLEEQTLRGIGLADVELRYVAPELLTGRSADVRSDVFTLGVLAYEMATGKRPYEAESMPGLLGVMLAGSVDDPRRLQPTLPEPAAAAIVTALRTRPEDRYQTARAFSEMLFAGSSG
jgi:serine/threonine protein kinase